MRKIELLPDEVINKIAAGEIIERPVSIVKEMVENSIDAGSTEIRIEVEKGGKQLIRITDNGCGIGADDVAIAFERHATSKIRKVEDLHEIGSMGFRGEALASIASVGQVQIKTRTPDEEVGLMLSISNGEIGTRQPVASIVGTVLEVRNLFFNTPARKKFLKSDASEAAAISHMVNAFALVHPEISFHLYQDHRETLTCPATTSLKDRVFQIFGSNLLDQLLEIDEKLYHFHLRGFVSRTDALRTNKNLQYFFINRRFVKDRVLSNSIYVAYRFFAENGQYPATFLFLDMPLAMVDVNVHPAKYEVRFLQQGLVQKGIIDSIQRVLTASRPLPSFQMQPNPYLPKYSAPELGLTNSRLNTGSMEFGMAVPELPDLPRSGLDMPAPPQRRLPEPGEYKVIGHYDNTYILVSDESGLIIVDQHVCHERVLYEQLLQKEEEKAIISQPLLIPLVQEVNPAQMMLLEEYFDRFRSLGFEMEFFGHNSIVVKQVPQVLSETYSTAIQKMLNDLEKLYRAGSLDSMGDEMRKSIACQASVKINMPLTQQKMEYLIQELLKTRTPQVCPHGRPIILRISHYEIEKNFRRI